MIPIAYTFDGDVSCPSCAIAIFGREGDHPWPRENARDTEGNLIGALASWDMGGDEPVICGTCRDLIYAGNPVTTHLDSLADDECECDNCLADLSTGGDA